MKTRKRNRHYKKTFKREKIKKINRTYKKRRQGGNKYKQFFNMTAKAIPSATSSLKYVPPAGIVQSQSQKYVPPVIQQTQKNYYLNPISFPPPKKPESFLDKFGVKPANPTPKFSFLEEAKEAKEEIDLDKIFLDDGTINVENLLSNDDTRSIFVPPKNDKERRIEKQLKDEYKKIISEFIVTMPSLKNVENLESKKSWIGWTAIAKAIDPRAITAENVSKGVLDVLFMGVRTVVLTTVEGYKMITPTVIQTKVTESLPTSVQAYGIEGYTLLRAINSGSFSSIIGLTLSCLTNTDWNDPTNVTLFYDRIVGSVSPILPVLLEDITKEGCKTLIPGLVKQIAVEGSLVHTALSKGYSMLNEEDSLSKSLIENLAELGNVIVPLISQHMNTNGINCGGDIITNEEEGKRCLGDEGYSESKKYFNSSLTLIVRSMNNCLKENSQDFLRALVSSEHPDLPQMLTQEEKERKISELETFIRNEDFTPRLLNEITNRFLTSVRNDIKEVRTVAEDSLRDEMQSITSNYLAVVKKKLKESMREDEERKLQEDLDELEELIEPSFKRTDLFKTRESPEITTTVTTNNKFTEAREGTVSISKLTTKFDQNALIKLLGLWADNINTKLGENKPYSVTECLLEAIDLRLPHLLTSFFGVENEKLLDLVNRASSEPLEEDEANLIIEAIIEDYVKPIAITLCIEEYIKPESYNELKMVSLYSFFK
jgi:hypothetical protein